MNMDLGSILKQAEQLKEKLSETQKTLEDKEVEATVGGGMVTVKVNGAGVCSAVSIDPSLIESNEKEMIEDLVRAAFNQAGAKAKEEMKQEMMKLTGGMPIPGLS